MSLWVHSSAPINTSTDFNKCYRREEKKEEGERRIVAEYESEHNVLTLTKQSAVLWLPHRSTCRRLAAARLHLGGGVGRVIKTERRSSEIPSITRSF